MRPQTQDVGVHHGRSQRAGIFHKPETTGKQIGDKRVFWVEPGCLVFNIVFAWEQAVALTSEAEAGMIASHRFPMYRSRNGKLLEEYAWRYFSSPHGKHDLGIASPGGAGRNKTLGQEEFKRLMIPVPPIEYQRMAVDMLATMDRTIEQTSQLIAAKRKLKKGLAQQLLTSRRRLPGFSKPWNSVSLSDVARINPSTRKPSCSDEQVSFLAMANIGEGGGTLNPQVRPFREVASGFTSFQDDDVLVAKITPCFENFKGALVRDLKNGLGFGTTELHVLRAKASACPEFLFYLTLSEPFRERGVVNMTGSAGQKRVPTGFLRNFRFDCPDRDEQERIAAVLGVADREVAVLERKLVSLQELKRGLMQKLLIGHVSAKAEIR